MPDSNDNNDIENLSMYEIQQLYNDIIEFGDLDFISNCNYSCAGLVPKGCRVAGSPPSGCV